MIDITDFIFDCVPTVKDIKILSDIIFGQGYLSESQIEHYLQSENCIVTTVCHKDRFIGVSTQIITTVNTLDPRVKNALQETLQWNSNQKIILHKQTFLADAYRGMGIGRMLAQRSEEKAAQHKLPKLSIVWNYPGNKIAKILKKNGYKKVTLIPRYWYADSVANNYKCSICGNPCMCDALIMVKSR